MADAWDQAAQEFQKTQKPSAGGATTPAPSDDWKVWQQDQAPGEKAGPQGFWSSLADTTGIPQMWDEAKKDPLGALKSVGKEGLINAATGGMYTGGKMLMDMGRNAYQHIGQAGAALQQGDINGALGHYAGAVPLVGPMAYKAGEQASQGNYAGAAGTAVGAIGQAAIPELAERAAPLVGRGLSALKRGLVKNINNPVQEQALASVAPDVQMSVGQRAGNQKLQRIEQNLPGAQQFAQTQQEQLATKGNQLAAQQSPVQTDPYGAGQGVDTRLQQRITRLKGQADNLYGQVRQGAAANQRTVQTGVQQVPGPNPAATNTPAGMPVDVPITQTVESPVELAPYRAQLQPLYDDLTRLMPEARRQASPAFRALQDLMTSKDPYMSAMDFDKSLGAIKSIARDGDSPYLTSRSQGIAKQIVQSGEQQLNAALSATDPALPAKLQTARNTVRSYYDTAELRDTLNASSQEPAALYNHLIAGGDSIYNSLQQLRQVAPKQLQTVGRTFLEQLMDKATNEGGFAKAQTIMNQWERLGPRTKDLLYGPQAADIDNFMLAAKTLTRDFNPSGTAKMGAALGTLGLAGEGVWHLLTGHPITGVGIAGGFAGAKALSKLLLSPGGAKTATAALSPFMQGVTRAPMAGAATMGPPAPQLTMPQAAQNVPPQIPQLTNPEQRQ